MEDEGRKLPAGWVRSLDPETHHQFFVDTTKDPPRSIWHHPYDDEEYLATLPTEERERLEQESMERRKNPSRDDIIAAHSDDDEVPHYTAAPAELPPRPAGKGKARDQRTFGRRFKDKVTGMTHEQRAAERQRQAQYERELWETHLRIRQAMTQAAQTGQPVHVGKDSTGRDVYVEPPYGGGFNTRYPGMNQGARYNYDPYGMGSYTTPNARYIRPAGPYGRPAGSGYGGAGLPLVAGAGLGAGLGLLLGGALLF
jgi:hypothetical protein